VAVAQGRGDRRGVAGELAVRNFRNFQGQSEDIRLETVEKIVACGRPADPYEAGG
jgi:hypothetical protein